MTGNVRIIGGLLRGRKLQVMSLPGLRPSGDRSRETLFNWIGPSIQGLRCLDLFAGTGVLGLEALSRGARSVTLVERSPQAVEKIRDQIESWPGRERIDLVAADAFRWLPRRSDPFDLVFIDPPHGLGMQIQALMGLVENDRLALDGRVCVEYAARESWAGDHQNWLEAQFECLKSARFGGVELSLLQPSTL